MAFLRSVNQVQILLQVQLADYVRFGTQVVNHVGPLSACMMRIPVFLQTI